MIYQLKVTLKHSQPAIWRRVEVRPEMTLGEFHEVLQAVMEWTDSHMHQFAVGKRRKPEPGTWSRDNGLRYYSQPEFGLEETENENKITLEKALPAVKGTMVYEYDFGDGWEHEILLEKIKEAEPGVRYPRLTSGKRRGPMDDSGGIWGWEETLLAAEDRKHPEHEDRREWLGLEKGEQLEDVCDVAAIDARLEGFGKKTRGERAPVEEPQEDAEEEVLELPEGVRLVSYDIVAEALSDPRYTLPEAAENEIEKLFFMVNQQPKKAVRRLEELVAEHGEKPRLLNYLYAAYTNLGDDKKARELAERNLQVNPDYLFAKLAAAEIYLQAHDFEKVKEIMQDKWEIGLHEPGRTTFHVTEILGFMGLAGRYLAGIGKLEAATVYLEAIEQLDPDGPAARAVHFWIMQAAMKGGMDKMMQQFASREMVQRARKKKKR